MPLEIEQKFHLADAEALRARLVAAGAEPLGEVEQRDTYYNHPARDFARTDEALRLRRTTTGDHLTYKGPKLDAATKTRREIEVPLVEIDRWPELLEALGFRQVATVAKRRHRYRLDRPPYEVEIAIDQVDRVGLFAELEIVADPSQHDAAQAALGALADQLHLSGVERRSYLELLLGQGSKV